jgi:predicted DNA-binding protein with PD1-like motif
MEFSEDKGLIMVRLHQDEDLFESLKGVCGACGVRTGIVVSGIGMLKQAELSFFVKQGRYATVFFPEPLELVSLTGNVIHQDGEYHFHMHAVLARESKEAMAGHLSRGMVNVTNEIVILKTEIRARRDIDSATGLMALNFSREGE